jgi:CMP/dCMP kinase
MAVVTISREAGSGAEDIARRVCELLEYDYLDKALMTTVAAEVGLTEAEVIDYSEKNYKVKNFIERLLRPGPRWVGHIVTPVVTEEGEETLTLRQLNETECINLIRGTLRAAYHRDNIVVIGRGGQSALRDMPKALHVRIDAPLKQRIQRVQEQQRLSWDDARQQILDQDDAAEEYLERFFGVQWDDPLLYHLMINTGRWSVEAAAQIIVDAVRLLEA